ncbi:uncharacterized protein [Solanum tuberosum]|uniref:uncharacterized protein isoform X2 n=1 Tax=Solanum tuberosum TaxID=4113 RepID=UPI0003D296FD|nr:PREDICTED: uncharacterized protein LOC102582788 isoform X2 [Solanum tuberosum]
MNTVSADLLNGIVYASDAHVVWEDLKESFDKVNRVRIWQLHREITTLMQGTSSVSAYFLKLKELWSEYDVLVPSPSCGCEKSKDYIEHLSQQRLLHFLSGLNESYDQARRQILMKSITPSLGQAYAMIVQDESQQVTAAKIAAKTAEKMESLALQASNLNLQAGRGKGFKGRQCDYCKMKGHTRDNCYKLIGYPPRKQYGGGNENSEGWRRNTGNSDSWRREQSSRPAVNCADGASSSKDTGKGYPERQGHFYSPFSDEQCRQILGLLNKETGGHHANMAGIITCLMSMSHCSKDEWIVDSGATHHFTANKKFLQDSIDIDVSKKEQVHLPTGEKADITHTGSASLFGQNSVQGSLQWQGEGDW